MQDPFCNFRILIVDSSLVIHHELNQILTANQKIGFIDRIKNLLFKQKKPPFFPLSKIDSAFSHKEALNCITQAQKEEHSYALIFLKINTPDEIITIKYIREADPNIQIILFANETFSYDEIAAEISDADNLFILKLPFDSVVIQQLTRTLIKKWQLSVHVQLTDQSLQQSINDLTRELEYHVSHDPITKLYNRSFFLNLLEDKLQQAKLTRAHFSLILINIERFKLINESLGQQTGDQILSILANRLRTLLDEKEYAFARFGDDEFIVLANNTTDESKATAIANKILNHMEHPFKVTDRDLAINIRIGISHFPKDGDKANVLLKNVSLAMTRAKQIGPNNFIFYDHNMSINSLQKLELENELLHALTHNEFILHYQPEFDFLTSKFEGVEALIRWIHPKKGLIPPLDFIPLAEETGLILPIGEWVLRTACEQNKKWQEEGIPPMRIAVNMAPLQFEQPDLVKTIKDILAETGLEPRYLELELTENVLIKNIETIDKIRELKAMGVQIALDDFGMGYSSFSFLKRIPLDRIKIDRSYTQNIHSNPNDETIIRAIIFIANNMNLQVLAEGVETTSQNQFLKEEECKEAQGFYFCKPLPPDELIKFIKSYQ